MRVLMVVVLPAATHSKGSVQDRRVTLLLCAGQRQGKGAACYAYKGVDGGGLACSHKSTANLVLKTDEDS